MNWHHPIRSTGIEPCQRDQLPTAVDALARIKALRVRPGMKWLAVACKCRGWHIESAPREPGHG